MSCVGRDLFHDSASQKTTSVPSQAAAEAQDAPCSVPNKEERNAAWVSTHHSSDDCRGKCCKVRGCPSPPSYSVDGYKPAVFCGEHRRDGMYRVQHDCKTCGQTGCERPAEVSYMSQNGRINRHCSQHKMSEVIATRTKHCKHPGCSSIPKYGAREGPLSFCQAHKRTGMFTNSNGKLLVATRDGFAFRLEIDSLLASPFPTTSRPGVDPFLEDSSTATSDPTSDPESPLPKSTTGEIENWSSPSSRPVEKTPPSSAEKHTPLTRKLCEVPGCQVQPSYGISGTSRPLFCTGHKKKGMVGVKNRPCVFPGCDTRPHYGMFGGRPLYCATHKKKNMVHLLRENLKLQRETAERERDAFRKKASAERKKARKAIMLDSSPKKAKRKNSPKGEHEHKGQDQNKNENGRNRASEARKVVKGTGNTESAEPVGNFDMVGVRQRRQSAEGKGTKIGPSPRPSPRLLPKNLKEETLANSKNTGSLTDSKEAPTKGTPPTTISIPPLTVAIPSTRMSDTSGMSPSVEISLLKQARASAKAKAESSGSGRRPRAPSRKALEASGALKSNSAQWMTKDIREADARLKKELREQRRQLKAAGLKRGVVLETYVVPVEETDNSKDGSSSIDGDGSTSSGGTEKDGVLSNLSDGEKERPAGNLQRVEHQQPTMKVTEEVGLQHDSTESCSVVGTGEAAAAQPDVGSEAATEKSSTQYTIDTAGLRSEGEITNVKQHSNRKRKYKKAAMEPRPGRSTSAEGVSSPSLAAASHAGQQEGARPKARKANKRIREENSKGRKSGAGEASKRPRRGRNEGELGGSPKPRELAAAATVCKFRACQKTVVYGINYTGRYCKAHQNLDTDKVRKKKKKA